MLAEYPGVIKDSAYAWTSVSYGLSKYAIRIRPYADTNVSTLVRCASETMTSRPNGPPLLSASRLHCAPLAIALALVKKTWPIVPA